MRTLFTAVLAVACSVSCPALPFDIQHHIEPGDGAAVISEKAAKVLPRSNQVTWMRLETTFFIHFGPNTFAGVEWGTGHEQPVIFNPTVLDAKQWVRAIKEAGGTMIILVAKHHEGFCLWPSRYTAHSVAASPWLGGKGDVVRAVAEAARAAGLKLGVYLSPADLYQLRTNPNNPAGYYGNGSATQPSVIPTDPKQFQTRPVARRAHANGPELRYEVDDYNRYFLNQLYELLTDYGPIQEVWFDGANPDRTVQQTYQHTLWYNLIRRLQPGAVIFGKGPDVRWVGNERGIARETEWSVLPLPEPAQTHNWPDRTAADLGSREKLTPGSYLWWYPAEADVPILNGWFWSPAKTARTPAELVDIYFKSVGRNANLLLNLSPDNRGLVPENQLQPLRTMAAFLRETFERNLARGARVRAESHAERHAAGAVVDRRLDTFWEAASGMTNASVTLSLRKPQTFDVVSLQEAVAARGQRIESGVVEARVGVGWKTLANFTTVGHKRLLRFDPVASSEIRIHITGSRLEPNLAEVGLFKQSTMELQGDRVRSVARDWALVAADSQADGNPASHVFDGNPSTLWRSRAGATLPQALTIDMKSPARISGFSYLPRQDGIAEGNILSYKFETSSDAQNWSQAAQGEFGNIRNNPSRQDVKFNTVIARFFRFTAVGEVNGKSQVAAAEITVQPAH